MESNIISANFGGYYKVRTDPAWLIDHGMQLAISGIDLPDEFECHFSNSRSVAAKRQIGEDGVVTIPDEYFLSNAAQIFCWIYLHPTVDSGVTEYEIVIPLRPRPNVDPAEPTQEQQDIVDQAIAALNVAMEATSADAASASASATAAQAAVDSVLNMTVSADTLPSGSDASVTKSVVDDAVHLAFGIPQGAQGVQGEQGVQGPTGATPNFTIGTVQTLLPTQDATATITGTAEAPVLNLGIPKGYSGDANNLAADYSSTKTYAVGDYCIYNGSLYRCTTAITTAEAWTAAHWTAAVLGDDVCDLKSALDYKSFTYMPPTFKTANYSNAAGTRAYKWAGNYLKTYQKVNAGTIAKGALSYGSASLTLDGSLVIDMRECDNAYFMARYTSTFISEANCFLIIRFLNTAYGGVSSAEIALPTGANKSVFIDLRKLAYENGVSLNDKPMVVFREVGYQAHTATGVEELEFDFYGFHVLPLTNEVKPSATEDYIYRFKPYYAHLFINTGSDAASDTYVPSQSAYDIEIAARLGFNSIELNTHVLSDGAVLVMHGVSEKFGAECVAASGSAYTDEQIQETSFGTVSLEWVKNNVVFKAKYPKSQTAPLTLEEALSLCKTNHLVPFVQRADENTVALCDKIMGKDNYVLYTPARSDRAKSNAMVVTFANVTEAEIYNWVKLFGSPCAYGTSNYGAFTLEKWKEIVDNVHKMGGLMAFAASYMTPAQANDLWEIGFDFAASGWDLNPATEANLCTLSADNGFDDFTVTNGEEADGQVTLAENGTIILAETFDSVFLSGMWLDVTFKGSISVSMGRFITHANSGITSATRKTIHLSTYALNSAPTFEIKATATDTVIENVVFKASKL